MAETSSAPNAITRSRFFTDIQAVFRGSRLSDDGQPMIDSFARPQHDGPDYQLEQLLDTHRESLRELRDEYID